MIRSYSEYDISNINELGKLLHDNYKFSLNRFSNCYVYEDNGTVIGFIIFSIMYEKAEIIDIAVDAKYRNNKIGTLLINDVIKKCDELKCSDITLEVNQNNNAAVEFYKRNNFDIISVRKNYYKKGLEDAYIMKLDLR